MQESMYKYLRVGLIQSQAYPGSLKSDGDCIEDFKRTVRDPYFTAIEFHSPKDPPVRKECMKMLKDSGMYRTYLATVEMANHGLNMLSDDAAERKRAVEVSCRLIDDALEWEAEEIMFYNARDVSASKRQQAYGYLEEYCARLAEYMVRQGTQLRLVMEVIDRNPLAKNFLCGPIDEAVVFCRNVRKHYPDFGLVLDLSHMPLLGEAPRDTVRKAGDTFLHGHIGTCVKDPKSPLCGDMHPGFQAEGSENGADDVVEFIKAGMESGAISKARPMPLAIEVHPYGNETSQQVIDYAKGVLDQAWAKV